MGFNGMKQVQKIRGLIEDRGLHGIFIAKRGNFAWATGGKQNYINNGVDQGEAYLYITVDRVFVVANQIEMPRILAEEVGELGFEPLLYDWYGPVLSGPFAKLIAGKRVGVDCGLLAGEWVVDVSGELAQLRSVLDEDQMTCFRALAKQGAEVAEAVCRIVEPGWTEQQIRGETAREAHRRAINPMVILVATDERIFRFRHPIATTKRLDKFAMVVLCVEQDGLVASMTRLVHFGALPAELNDKMHKTAYVDAGMIANTQAGVSYADYFAIVRGLYAEVGYPDEWKLHHQGGPASFAPRDFLITPTQSGAIQANQAFAWNPSITGTKSEDTILLTDAGIEIISQTDEWPVLNVNAAGKEWKRPAILIR